MDKLSPTTKVAVRMGLFATGIALLGPAGGALFGCLGDFAPYIKDFFTEIEKQSPEMLKKFAESGGDVIKGFLGERLGDAKSEYNQLKKSQINYHLTGAILEIWENEFSSISEFRKSKINTKNAEITSFCTNNLAEISLNPTIQETLNNKNRELQLLKAQQKLSEHWSNEFKSAKNEKSHELLEQIFEPINQAIDSKSQLIFEIVEDEEKAQQILWENLKAYLVKWTDEKVEIWEKDDKNLVEYCEKVWTIDFEEEIKKSLFSSLQRGFKEKVINDVNVRDKFFYISFLQISGLIRQLDAKIDLRFDEIQDELMRVHFENAQTRINFSQLFQYLEKQEERQNSLFKAVLFITKQLDNFEKFSLDDEPPTKEEVLRYLQRVADEAGKAPLLLGGKKRIEFDRIRQKVEVSERKERQPYLAEMYEMMRKNNILPDEFGTAYSRRNHFQDVGENSAKSERKVVEWNEKTSKNFPRTIILGDPGFGKTWLLCYEARRIALEEIKKLEDSASNIEEMVLPIRVRLSDVASFCPQEDKKIELVETLADLASAKGEQLKEKFTVNFWNWVKKRINEEKDCVLLFDALDEVPEVPEQGIGKQKLIEKLLDFSEERKNLRILLTSRIVGYVRNPIFESKEIEIVWLENQQIREFVRIWFAEDLSKKDKFNLILDNQSQVFALAQIPLMLSLMCRLLDLKTKEEEFPTTKTQIYEECLLGYLNDWQIDKGEQIKSYKLQKEIKILSQVAYRLFKKEKEQFRENEFISELEEAMNDDEKAENFFVRNEHKILIKATNERDPMMRFLHLTFQEYLTASHLAEIDWDAIVYQEHILYDSRWNEVLQLLGGKLSSENAEIYIKKLLEINDKEDIFYRPFELAMFVAVEAGDNLKPEFKDYLIKLTLEKFFNPPKFRKSEDFFPIIKRWGKSLIKYILPKLEKL